MSYEVRQRQLKAARHEVWKIENQTTSKLSDTTWERIAHEQKMFQAMFEKLGFPPGYMTAVENPYWPIVYEVSRVPWYEYHCALGIVRVGWRKRVISIEWPNDGNRRRIQVSDDVTHIYDREGACIHAWSWEKCETYLGLVLAALRRERSVPAESETL